MPPYHYNPEPNFGLVPYWRTRRWTRSALRLMEWADQHGDTIRNLINGESFSSWVNNMLKSEE